LCYSLPPDKRLKPDDRDADPRKENSTSDTARDSTTAPIIPRPDSNQPQGAKIDNEADKKEEKTKWGHNPDTWMVILTALLMVVGIVTAIVFYGQFQQMYNQTEILSGEAERAAGDAVTTRRYGRQQLREMQMQTAAIQRQMRQDQRAWMNFSVETVSPPNPRPQGGFPEIGQPFFIRVTFHNIGKSAALNVKTCSGERYLVAEETPDFKCPNKAYVSSGTVFPGPVATFSDLVLTQRFLEADRDNMMSNQWNVWVFGRVKYDDIFGVHHWFDYCAHLLSGGAYAVCKQHTATDHNE